MEAAPIRGYRKGLPEGVTGRGYRKGLPAKSPPFGPKDRKIGWWTGVLEDLFRETSERISVKIVKEFLRTKLTSLS